jgi:hypothetical protein
MDSLAPAELKRKRERVGQIFWRCGRDRVLNI